MNWWKRWKAKYWDEIEHPAGSAGLSIWPPHTETPRLRAMVQRLIEQAETNPLGALIAFATILGSVAAIMSALL